MKQMTRRIGRNWLETGGCHNYEQEGVGYIAALKESIMVGLSCISSDMNNAINMEFMVMRIAEAVYATII